MFIFAFVIAACLYFFTMKFRTEYSPSPASFRLDPHRPVLLTGSCFTDNIAARMRDSLWDARNPAGALFNPLSIATIFRQALHPDEACGSEDFFEDSSGYFHSWLLDSGFSGISMSEVREKVSKMLTELRESILGSQALIVTFGSAYCYFLADRPPFPVGNCHKQPSAHFVRRRLEICEITNLWQALLSDLRAVKPDLRVIFTVSPVRHLRDGLHENILSKSILHLAIDKICDENAYCEYFGAYEILNDDLRDYRWYASDLAHPSEEAIDYVWEMFRLSYLSPESRQLLDRGSSLVKLTRHRPILMRAEEYEAWQSASHKKCREFLESHPGMLDIF